MSWRPFKKYTIGREGKPYLTRWDILGTRYGFEWLPRIFLHRFHRSDSDAALHDHPWAFTSIILWGGYWEMTQATPNLTTTRWYPPFSVLYRPATWAHRIVLNQGAEGKVWTLVLTGGKTRSWGFNCPERWTPWKVVVAREEAGQHGCD